MATKEPGYVYIFTNDSFRDDWVKIGNTINLKERLKTLFNTSLPFSLEYEGRLWSLSAFSGIYLLEHMHNKSEAYQGPKYYSYQGKTQ